MAHGQGLDLLQRADHVCLKGPFEAWMHTGLIFQGSQLQQPRSLV